MTPPINRTTLPVEVSVSDSSEDYFFKYLEIYLKRIPNSLTWPCPLSQLFGDVSHEVASKLASKNHDNSSAPKREDPITSAMSEMTSLLGKIHQINDKRRIFKNLFELFPFIDKKSMETEFLEGSSYFQKLLNYTLDYLEEHKLMALMLALWHLREANRSFAQHLATKDTTSISEQNRIEYNEEIKKALYFCSNALKIDSKLGRICPECLYVTNELILQMTKNCLEIRLKNSKLDKSYLKEIFDQIEQKKELCFSPTHSSFFIELYTVVVSNLSKLGDASEDKNLNPHKLRHEYEFCPVSPQPIPHKYLPALQEYRQLFERFTSHPGDVAHIRSTQADLTGRLIDLAEKVLEDAFLIVGPPPCPYDIRVLGSIGREEACPFSDIEYMILYSSREGVYSTEYQEELRKKWHEEYFTTLAEVFNFLMILIGESGTYKLIFPCVSTLEGFRLDPSVNPAHHPKNKAELIGEPRELAQIQKKEKKSAIPQEKGQIIRHSQSLKKSPHDPSLFHDYVTFMQEIIDQDVRRERYALQLFSHRWEDYNKAWISINFHKIDLKLQFINLFHLLSDIAFYKGIRQTNTLDIIKELSSGEAPVFTPRSGELLREFFASLYHIRSRVHLSHQRQCEDAFAPHPNLPLEEKGVLRKGEPEQLEKCYWLVLRPLYRALEKVLKGGKRFEEVFNSLDLLKIGAEDIFQLQEGEGRFRSALVHLVAYVARNPPYFEMLKRYYQTIPGNLENFSLKFSILEALESTLNQDSLSLELSRALKSFIGELATISDPSGFRLGMVQEVRAFHTRLKKATNASAESWGKIEQVQIESSMENPELRSCFLQSDVIREVLDETGHIRNSYPGSAHWVTGSKCGLHFKEMPVQPLMEYAVYNLFFRLGGHLSPFGELVHFKVTVRSENGSKTINYPVLISKSLFTDKTLKTHIPSEIKDIQAWKKWTWMILCTFLTKPGDGLPSNYIFEGENIFCIDNDISFVIPYIHDGYFSKKINFCSVLLFLYVDRALAPEVLNQFCDLDIDTILSTWIEDVKAKEKAYLALFPKKEDREKWAENPDLKKRFSATAVFCEGAIITLKFQFHQLQNYIRLHRKRDKGITALELLEQMVIYCDFYKENKVGLYIANAYRQALAKKNLSLEQKIQEELKRQRGGSLSLPEVYKVCLNQAPSFKDVETLQLWTPSEASRELSTVILKESSPYVSIVNSDKHRVIQANFRGLVNGGSQQAAPPLSEMRQRQILSALLSQREVHVKKLTTVILQYCDILDFRSLEPFLHPTLEHLDLRFCHKITDSDLVLIQRKCPRLKRLYLSGCTQVYNVCSHRFIGPFVIKENSPLSFLALEEFEISDAANLEIIKLQAPKLQSIIAERNSRLRIVEIDTNKIPKWRFKNCPQFVDQERKFKKIAAKVLDFFLDDATEEFFQTSLSTHKKNKLIERARESKELEFIRKDLFSIFIQVIDNQISKHAIENSANILLHLVKELKPSEKTELIPVFYKLGFLYQEDRRFDQALEWYRIAAEQGHIQAQVNLGICFANGWGVPKDEKEAVMWYRKAAEQGHAAAHYNLGICFADGKGVPKDEKEAIVWYRKAAEQGHAAAHYNLGICFANGRGVLKDEKEATIWYRKAAELGHAASQYNLGICFADGRGVPKDEKEAVVWYRIAAEQGHAEAQYNFGVSFDQGLGVPKDEEEAVFWYRRSAEQGHVVAQFNLGVCFANGIGVPKDEKEAIVWYRKAAEQGHAEAQYNLGVRITSNRGVPKDEKEATVWYRKAAEQGLAEAQYNFGVSLANGKGIPKDEKEAIVWYRKAAEQAFAPAQCKLGACLANGRGVSKDEKEAIVWYRKAAEQAFAEAQYSLGVCLANGRGVPKDEKEAVVWYRKAAEQGYAEAQYNLGVYLASGRGVPKDEKEAIVWYRKAAEQGLAVAQYNLGVCFDDSRGVPKDEKETIVWFRKAAEQGYAEAQYSLGVCLANGRGVPKDEKETIMWYRKAAEQGHAAAQFNLGGCIANESGISKEAIMWYRKAAEQGNADAQYKLGVCFDEGKGVPKDYKEAFFWYRKAAEQGHAAAQFRLRVYDAEQGNADEQFRLGVSFAQGLGVPKDYKEAVFWCRKAAEQGNADAQFNLGVRFTNGIGVPKDEKEASFWYRKAAEQGHADAQFNLAACFANDMGVLKNENEAISWYIKAAEQGHAVAQFNLGVCFDEGKGVHKDEKKAHMWYHKAAGIGSCYEMGLGVSKDESQAIMLCRTAAELGNADAQLNLGILYENGIGGIFKDEKTAVMWYQKAAEQGNAEAQTRLGIGYEKGIGISKDERKACEWYQKAAERGNAKAQTRLGHCYEKGIGVYKDEREACDWYRKAAEQGNAEAQTNLGVCFADGRGVAKDMGKAFEWNQKAAEQGNANAQYCLGISYQRGIGVAKDLTKALQWLQKAAEQGNAPAQYCLGISYQRGIGVVKNLTEAFQWFRKAAEHLKIAQYELGICYEYGEGVAKDENEAFKCYEIAALQGRYEAQIRLKHYQEINLSTSVNKNKALKKNEKAEKRELPESSDQ